VETDLAAHQLLQTCARQPLSLLPTASLLVREGLLSGGGLERELNALRLLAMLLGRFRRDPEALDLLTRPLASVARYLAVSSTASQVQFVYLGHVAEKAPLSVDLVARDVLALAQRVGDIAVEYCVANFECHPINPFPGLQPASARSRAGSLGGRLQAFCREVLSIKEIVEWQKREEATALAAERREAGMRKLRVGMLQILCRKALVIIHEFAETVGRYETGVEEFQQALLQGDNAALYFMSLRLSRVLRAMGMTQSQSQALAPELTPTATSQSPDQPLPASAVCGDTRVEGPEATLAGRGYFQWRLHRDLDLRASREAAAGEPEARQHAALATSFHGVSAIRELRGTVFDRIVVQPFLASQDRIASEEVDPMIHKCNETLQLTSSIVSELAEDGECMEALLRCEDAQAESDAGRREARGERRRQWSWRVEGSAMAGSGVSGATEIARTLEAPEASENSAARGSTQARGSTISFLAFLQHVYEEYHARFCTALSFVRELKGGG